MIETWSRIILFFLTSFFILSGTFFLLSSAIGIVRFPDIYTRLHAATKASTLGIAGILIGAFLFLYASESIVSGKLLLAIVFTLLTAPVSGHMISRAAHRNGVKPVIYERTDELEETIKKRKKQNNGET
ncbi:Na+/H+ antiporter subunit G [Virgibacillus phasianinus]|uniref:Na+/H+ antiporter subunit G n=1 Tax=Virgibacillus phasianinus TaxID=2017483 RepID=A0A220U4S1_9BACI|nr:monovalent cation/H(+) antiporter subunit G [Virgibacillus phasianinus]ASK63117.1 Na+/H+ antiporter subunit G [Virgibacillus phasianinus]